MTILDRLFIGGVAVAIVLFLLAVYCLIQYIRTRTKLSRLPKKRLKNKKKNKRIAKQKVQLKKVKKKQLTSMIASVILAGLLVGGMGYLSYYQSMNLSSDDSDTVVKSYYLLEDFAKELEIAKNKEDDEEKVRQNIRYLATSMTTQGIKKASGINTEEGQIILNRYYNAVKQLGMNASTQTYNFYGNAQLVDNFLEDIQKIKDYEKAAFTYYKVDESALSKEK
ncbi:hypothetical protein ATZ33_07290 [Enterococcus silesiacus]|uniref:Uncharacterized protein n=1 Tax=Enterococcus silesiacus TaxID=332949 RepID=A0A0S3KA83_9ENTE|nr:hypothetical protein [Enterococcus silesiacus]ALS01180.1 hypothetical protein ATZ33_07290 [Enterococcus silesiacus]OJG92575.1 hypothetical protein RV15_GL003000 [Enterococcus silesiacus]